MGELYCLGRWGNPGRRDDVSSYKQFGSPNRDNSWLGECHQMIDLGFKAEIRVKEVKINSAKPTYFDLMTEETTKKEGYLHI